MPKRDVEKRVDELRALRAVGATAQTIQTLKASLRDRSNVVVAQAAKMVGELRVQGLIPDLILVFDDMMEDGAKKDPQCRAKNAIIDALTAMEYSESAVFLRGIRHIQMEPVFGGHEDMAAPLRSRSAVALAQCTDLKRTNLFKYLVDAVTDKAEGVRTDVLRALEHVGGDDAAVLLRLKARLGDEEPRVVGQALESLLNLEGEPALSFIASFLETLDGDLFEEAALVLSGSRLPQALGVLKEAWERERNRPRGDALLRLIGASRRPDGIDFLISLIRDGTARDAATAAKALEVHRDSPEIRQRVEEAQKARS